MASLKETSWFYLMAAILGGAFLWAPGSCANDRWLTMETPHFAIHFQAELEDVAAEVAEIIEDVYEEQTRRTGYTLPGRTELILQSTHDLPMASPDSFYYPRLVITVVYPGSARKADPLRLWLTHEYTHVLQLDMNRGLAAGLRRIFGRIPVLTAPNYTQPYLWAEGYPVYEAMAASGHAKNLYYEMFLRTATLEGRIPTLDQALGKYQLDAWRPEENVYLYDWSFLDYIARLYGEEKLAEINRDYSGWEYFGLFTSSTGAEVRLTIDWLYTSLASLDLCLGVAKPLCPGGDPRFYLALAEEF